MESFVGFHSFQTGHLGLGIDIGVGHALSRVHESSARAFAIGLSVREVLAGECRFRTELFDTKPILLFRINKFATENEFGIRLHRGNVRGIKGYGLGKREVPLLGFSKLVVRKPGKLEEFGLCGIRQALKGVCGISDGCAFFVRSGRKQRIGIVEKVLGASWGKIGGRSEIADRFRMLAEGDVRLSDSVVRECVLRPYGKDVFAGGNDGIRGSGFIVQDRMG